jgi:hypothetical protein
MEEAEMVRSVPFRNELAQVLDMCVQHMMLLIATSVSMFGGGCSSAPAATSNRGLTEIIVRFDAPLDSPLTIDLGELNAERRIERPILLENRSGAEVTLARVETSCECVMLQGALATIPARASNAATLIVDLTNDPTFQGTLGVPVQGFDSSGRQLFDVVVRTRAAR